MLPRRVLTQPPRRAGKGKKKKGNSSSFSSPQQFIFLVPNFSQIKKHLPVKSTAGEPFFFFFIRDFLPSLFPVPGTVTQSPQTKGQLGPHSQVLFGPIYLPNCFSPALPSQLPHSSYPIPVTASQPSHPSYPIPVTPFQPRDHSSRNSSLSPQFLGDFPSPSHYPGF